MWEAEKTKFFSSILDLPQTKAETVSTRKLSDICNPCAKEGILLAIYAYIANNVLVKWLLYLVWVTVPGCSDPAGPF